MATEDFEGRGGLISLGGYGLALYYIEIFTDYTCEVALYPLSEAGAGSYAAKVKYSDGTYSDVFQLGTWAYGDAALVVQPDPFPKIIAGVQILESNFHLQYGYASSTGDNSTASVITLTQDTTTGSHMLVYCLSNNTSLTQPTFAVTDSNGSTYTSLERSESLDPQAGHSVVAEVFMATDTGLTAGEAITITPTSATGIGPRAYYAHEVTGTYIGSVYDVRALGT